MNPEIKFPALVISKSFIDKISYKYLVCDKRSISTGFKNVLIIDVLGNCFDTERVVQSGGLSVFYSIKLVGIIVRVKPVLKKPVYTISLRDMQNKLISVIEDHSKKFSYLGYRHELITEIKSATTYNGMINLFN